MDRYQMASVLMENWIFWLWNIY